MGLPKWLSRYSWHTFARCHPVALQPGAWPRRCQRQAAQVGLQFWDVLRVSNLNPDDTTWSDAGDVCLQLSSFSSGLAFENREPHCTSSLIQDQQSPTGFQQNPGLFRQIAPSYSGLNHHHLRWRCWQPATLVVLATRRRLEQWDLVRPPGNHLATNDYADASMYEWNMNEHDGNMPALFFWVNRFRGWSIWIRRTTGNFPYLNIFNWY